VEALDRGGSLGQEIKGGVSKNLKRRPGFKPSQSAGPTSQSFWTPGAKSPSTGELKFAFDGFGKRKTVDYLSFYGTVRPDEPGFCAKPICDFPKGITS
jgi:hypothetical protein